jgi:hypothetical protein
MRVWYSAATMAPRDNQHKATHAMSLLAVSHLDYSCIQASLQLTAVEQHGVSLLKGDTNGRRLQKWRRDFKSVTIRDWK